MNFTEKCKYVYVVKLTADEFISVDDIANAIKATNDTVSEIHVDLAKPNPTTAEYRNCYRKDYYTS